MEKIEQNRKIFFVFFFFFFCSLVLGLFVSCFALLILSFFLFVFFFIKLTFLFKTQFVGSLLRNTWAE